MNSKPLPGNDQMEPIPGLARCPTSIENRNLTPNRRKIIEKEIAAPDRACYPTMGRAQNPGWEILSACNSEEMVCFEKIQRRDGNRRKARKPCEMGQEDRITFPRGDGDAVWASKIPSNLIVHSAGCGEAAKGPCKAGVSSWRWTRWTMSACPRSIRPALPWAAPAVGVALITATNYEFYLPLRAWTRRHGGKS